MLVRRHANELTYDNLSMLLQHATHMAVEVRQKFQLVAEAPVVT
jgi:hypothetical protein